MVDIFFNFLQGCSRGLMAECGIVVSEFELQFRYYANFRTNTLGKVTNPPILPIMDRIVPLPFF